MDRDYHTLPTQDDFYQPSGIALLGWLQWEGFNLKLPLPFRQLCLLSYLWSCRGTILYNFTDTTVRLFFFAAFGSLTALTWMTILFSLPLFVVWSVVGHAMAWKASKFTLKVFWRYPVLLTFSSWWVVCVPLFCFWDSWIPLAQDGLNYWHGRYELVWEPVTRGKMTFPFPFGHWMLRDTRSMTVFEGRFVDNARQQVNDEFGLVTHQRELRDGAKCFPVPFDIFALTAGGNRNAPYSASHNCVTLLLQGVARRSVIGHAGLTIIALLTYLAIKPPQEFERVYKLFRPNGCYTESKVYKMLGFAGAGAPLEEEMEQVAVQEYPDDGPLDRPPGEVEAVQHAVEVARDEEPERLRQSLADFHNDADSTEVLVATILEALGKAKQHLPLDEDLQLEVAEGVLEKYMTSDAIDLPPLTQDLQFPPWKKQTWGQFVDYVHSVLSGLLSTKVVKSTIDWLYVLARNFRNLLSPILGFLARVMGLAVTFSKNATQRVFNCICMLLDQAWGKWAPKRVKTVWGLTGLLKSGLVSYKARFAAECALMDYEGRGMFLDDYETFTNNIKDKIGHLPDYRDKVTGEIVSKNNAVGGPQRRPIRYSQPVMSDQCAELLGFKEGEYVQDERYQDRINRDLAMLVPQAVDGVLFGDKNPDRICKSIARYEKRYEYIPPEDKTLIEECADAIFDEWPQVFADREIMPVAGVEMYIKPKYSAGSPFIRQKGYRSREALMRSGVMDVLKRNARAAIREGKYPVQFYHAFAKSQAVKGSALHPPPLGTNKDLRTVVSQDIPSYLIDQIFQLEGNKRITWETYGSGSGMALNQSMDRIFEEFSDLKQAEGGRYIIADATAYDSKCKPVLFHGAGRLYERGYENHWSGKGKEFASVIKAKYDAMQDAWVFGITEPDWSSLVFSLPDRQLAARMVKSSPKLFVDWESTLWANNVDPEKFTAQPYSRQVEQAKTIQAIPGKALLSPSDDFRPAGASWQGRFVVGADQGKTVRHQTYWYDQSDNLTEDIRRVTVANRSLVSNVHAKNRGGGTGQSATSWDNTATFKLGLIAAWVRTVNAVREAQVTPKDFFNSNRLYNTSDDTVWWSKDFMSAREIDLFKTNAASFGIQLVMDTTKKITEVEYLSKWPRSPTAEDSADWKSWRSGRLANLWDAYKHGSQKLTRGQIEQIAAEDELPRFMVVQNPTAIIMRRTAFRYYQGSARGSKWLYTDAERGSGHAYVCAFQPDLYRQFAQDYADTMNRLCKEQHLTQHWKLVSPSRFEMRLEQVNSGWKNGVKLSPRQEAFLTWQKQAKFPSYRQVLDVHLRIKDPDPLAHEVFLRKLNKAWRGNDEILNEAVDFLYDLTDKIPEEIKKFSPGVDMLYAERPWDTNNMYIEKFIYLRLLTSAGAGNHFLNVRFLDQGKPLWCHDPSRTVLGPHEREGVPGEHTER